ncbi:MAG TPA: AAA family ATPase [Verrucomicrobiales bacterium]|nr:AAA family ATPase [Verrucomicrobiales bacterium]
MEPFPGYLTAVRLKRDLVPGFDRYPVAIPAVRELDRLPLHPKVNFLIGENGSGKSTLLEAIAVKWGFNAEGGTKNFNFATRESHSELHDLLVLERSKFRAHDGFFLRAESFYNVATEIDQLSKLPGSRRPFIEYYGGESLHRRSHGEAFLALMNNRFRGDSFFVLDEPESALSPQRQMTALVVMHRLIADNCQFLIATHSPILLSYPDAWIYECGEAGLRRVAYEETQHFRLTKDFLTRHRQMLHHLLNDESAQGELGLE